MIKTMVPNILDNVYYEKNKKNILNQLKQMNADEIVLFINNFFDIEESCKKLRELMDYFAENGIRTYVWIQTLLMPTDNDAVMLKDINGKDHYALHCPLDKRFLAFYLDGIKKVAETGVRKIMLEDDFRLHMIEDAPQCFCDNHLKLYSELSGETVTAETFKEKMLNHKPNKYRKVFIDGINITMQNFAQSIRNAVDEIDDSIEIVLDCGPSLWGGDGTDAIALANILKGKGKPEVRLIGAPYWQTIVSRHHLMSVVDYTRHQAYECRKNGVFNWIECDPYPRPRYNCPSCHAEFFHTVAIADGNFDGVFKYGMDYTSGALYETGYAKETERNHGLYLKIEEIFKNKKAVGFHLVENFDTIRYSDELPDAPEAFCMETPSRNFLSENSFSVDFEPGGVNILFGENANNFDKAILKNGTIIDLNAAKILEESGIDTGLKSVKPFVFKNRLSVQMFDFEYFFEEDERSQILKGENPELFDIVLNKNAKVLSEYNINGQTAIGSYIYENANNQRFLVFCFNARDAFKKRGFYNYCRQRQVTNYYEWLNGKKPDVISLENPYLYILAKKDMHSMAIGLWNSFEDRVLNPYITLGEEYKTAEFINCDGILEGNKITITSTIHGYDYCFIHLKK